MLKLLLYAHDQELQKRYLQALPDQGVMCAVVSSFEEFFKQSTTIPCSGVLIDIVSSIRATPFDREVIKELLEVYPSLRLRWDPATGDIRTLMTGAGPGQNISIKSFISTYCAPFVPRCLRMRQRRHIHCNVLYSLHDQMSEEVSQKTVTMDLSEGGCFLFMSQNIAVGERLWVRFLELMDKTPILVEVRWCQEWGKSMNVPGVGVRFVLIQSGQLDEIQAMCDADSGSRTGALIL
ncbi:MAG: PilZ domain-containing protein [Desulfuromonas sp.]|nr:PilZ domain-containing protein [Desulfuromonas sp.]